ncbi:MFS transporter [Nocardioides anomalus]|uniref:MFS transporter n=1 Tax=Nocardioides anomalus TaxID=2712223 RepID=A0A6G6WDF4_9ACTN|nr:MFS transporter [Nocardioides anomalus]QIG43249.1 MFS transporter [Nocardioides anomalus]
MTSGPTADFPTAAFTRFWVAETVSSFGTYVTLLALQTVVVLTLDGTAQDVGWLNSARWLPYLVLGLVVGALVDRRRRRPLLVGTDLASAALLCLIPVAWALDVLSLPLLCGIVAVYGAATLVNGAASMSIVPRLVPRAHLQRAHARIDGADAVAQTAGPALAGLLVKVVGAPLAVLVDAATYLFSALAMSMVAVEEPTAQRTGRPRLREEMRDGVRWVYRGSGLATLAAATHLWFAANAVLGAVLAPYALLTLGLTPLQLGLATAVAGVGGVVGATTSSAGGRRLGTGGAVIAAHAATTVGVVVMALAGVGTSGWVATAVLGLGQGCHGFAIGFGNSHEMTYRQALTPDALQARTNTTMRAANRAVIVVVAPLGGLLAVQIGNRGALAVAAGVFAVVVVWLAASPFRTADAMTAQPPNPPNPTSFPSGSR